MMTKHKLTVLILFSSVLQSVLCQNLLSCDETSSSGYACDKNLFQEKYCNTFAMLRANARYSSPSNLSSYLNISPSELAEANNFSSDTEFFSNDQPLLIPIQCKCGSSSLFEAEARKVSVKGESFYEIAESLEGLTTCKAIRDKNPSVSPWNLEERINVLVPLKCACPSSTELTKLLLSYPVREGDTLSGLASEFNLSAESIAYSNERSSKAAFRKENSLVPLSTLLIPVEHKPSLNLLVKAGAPNSSYPAASIQLKDSHERKKRRMKKIRTFVAIAVVALAASVAIGSAFFFIHMKKKKKKGGDLIKNIDLEQQQQLSLSVRTTSDKKVSFEGSQYNFDDPTESTTPRKTPVEIYSYEELQKATEDFSVSNLIEGSVYHGRLKGKNLAIKRTRQEIISRIDFLLFHERIHRHPNIIRFLGTCVMEGPDPFIVLEYAKNGSLKDWIHGGLAIKSHFIASCSCFLTWNQRLKICLDVATALQYMHQIINPSYVHRNIKSRNIFLDDEFNAKVGNFGMANCVEIEEKDQESALAQWNKGYLAPEYIEKGLISPSADIFAYGVVLLEVLSGKPPVEQYEEEQDGKFTRLCDEIKVVLQSEGTEELREWMDGALGENYSFDTVVMLANLARSCVEDDPASRPNAGEIVEKLLRLVQELPEGDHFPASESSCKPLVKAAARDR